MHQKLYPIAMEIAGPTALFSAGLGDSPQTLKHSSICNKRDV